MPKLTPMGQERPYVLRDTLSGRFVQSGPRRTHDVLEGYGVSKRAMSDTELAHRKRAQGYISRTTSTLGLGALAMKGGAVARAGGRTSRLLHVGADAVKAEKLNRAALNTGIVSSGIGGLGGYNFASYTAEDARRNNVRVKKNWSSGMDFGLSSVQQGSNFEEVSKSGFSFGNAAKMTVKSTAREVHRGPRLISATPAAPPRPMPSAGPKAAGGGFRTRMNSGYNSAKTGFNGMSTRKKIGVGAGVGVGAAGVGYGVSKAYDPERSRQKRLTAYGDAAMAGAGAAGLGAAYYGNKAAGRTTTRVVPADPKSKHQLKGKVTTRTGLRAVNDVKEFRGGMRNAAAAGALGVGAAGLAVGSHRIRQYKKGRGGSYKPLRQLEY